MGIEVEEPRYARQKGGVAFKVCNELVARHEDVRLRPRVMAVR